MSAETAAGPVAAGPIPGALPIALDALGGDLGAAPNVEGAVQAARAGVPVLLVGERTRLHAELGRHTGSAGLPIEVIDAPDVIGMDEHASDVRGRPEASINVCTRLVKEGRAAAAVSMGHSGATMASALLTLGRIRGVDRPAILTHPPAQGGWNAFITNLTGTNNFDPASHLGLRGNGDKAWFGWPNAPKLEELRQQWFDAPNEAEQKRICREIQADFMREPTYLPLGAYYPQTVFSAKLTGMRSGLPQFYDIRWA